MPAILMVHEQDPREALIEKVGSVESQEVFHNQVLVAVYLRPEKTAGGIILTQSHRDEDKNQGKVGLIIKLGPKAFSKDANWSWPENMAVGDWVYFRASDGWPLTLNRGGDAKNVLCRTLDDVDVRGRIQHPDEVW